MIYEKPKCDCGDSGNDFEYSGLKCVKCDISYHPELSSDGKLIRGGRI